MNFIIDIGNTRIKLAFFTNKNVIFQKTFLYNEDIDLNGFIKKYSPQKCIISATGKVPEELKNTVSGAIPYIVYLNYRTPLPIKNLYKSPETLGYDRIAGATEAYNMFPGENVLIIDIGSAITYDILTQDAEFLGGNISPGINMRAEALNKHTENLPLTRVSTNHPLIGRNTDEALSAGIMNGIYYEITGYIAEFETKYKNLKIIMTGGDAFYFESKLKNTIFAEPNLITKGLNRILIYNAK